VAISEKRKASPLIAARADTENTPGPVSSSFAPLPPAACANAPRIALSARSCASMSYPAASV